MRASARGSAEPRDPFPRPGSVGPMLARSGSLPDDDEGWAYEVKWDGVRAIVYVREGRMDVRTRNNKDATARYPELHGLPKALAGRDAVLDGEIVAFDDDGRVSFQRLQHRMGVTTSDEARRRARDVPVSLMLFDVLWLDGRWTTALPYAKRRRLLEGLGLDGPCWDTPAYRTGEGRAFLDAARALRLEGLVAKRLDSPYVPDARASFWIKIKEQCRQEFVVGGWTPGEGKRGGTLGALLVGVYDEDPEDGAPRLRYAGKVGTGYGEATLAELGRRMAPLARRTSPFHDAVPRDARFVEPELVAEVEFTEWTRGGTLRHPSFKGLREDKEPEDVVREEI